MVYWGKFVKVATTFGGDVSSLFLKVKSLF